MSRYSVQNKGIKFVVVDKEFPGVTSPVIMAYSYGFDDAQLIVDALNAYEPPSVLVALQGWLDIPWVHALDDKDIKSRQLRIGRTGSCFQILLVERQKDLLDVFVCHNYEGPLIKIYNHADIDKVKELIDFFHKFHGDDNGTE